MHSEKLFISIAIILCVVIFWCWQKFFYEPAQQEILLMQLETRKLTKLMNEISELKKRYENFDELVDRKDKELDYARNFLPLKISQDEFADTIYSIASSSEIQVISIQFGEKTSQNKIESQIVIVRINSDYISVMNFIREILDGGRLVSLEKFSANSLGAQESPVYEIMFKIFSRSAEET